MKKTKQLAIKEDAKETESLTVGKAFSLTPTSLEQAMKLAEMIANSDLAPKDFKGKAGNCLIAMQMGMEVGLAPMQAIQNIAVINGRPTLWGDAALALVLASPVCEYVRETWDEKSQTWTCRGKRRDNKEEGVYTFSGADADKAGLLKKDGTWQNYRKRMIQMRARAFCLRDNFADVLKGLAIREEVEDYVDTTAQVVAPVAMPKPVQETREPIVDESSKSPDGMPMVGGEFAFFRNEMTRMGADMEEVAQYAKDRFTVSTLELLSRSQAKQIIEVWKNEPAVTE